MKHYNIQYPKLLAVYIRYDSICNTYFSERHFDNGSLSRMGTYYRACPESILILKKEWPNAVVWLLKELPSHFDGNINLGRLG